MAAVLGFFIKLAPAGYFLLALGLLIGIQQLTHSISERRNAAFGLEREIAQRHMTRAISTLVLVGSLALADFFLIVFLVPNIPALSQLATSTMNPLMTPTGTFPLAYVGTLNAGTPVSTSSPQATGCIPGQISISYPKVGDEIKGSITLKGTATIPNFGFYKYEFSPTGSNTWATIVANNKVVVDNNLGSWDTSLIPTGDYLLRLVVIDSQGAEMPACVIPLRIKAP
jgi:hypothetical protein